jgi:hypothetical protein
VAESSNQSSRSNGKLTFEKGGVSTVVDETGSVKDVFLGQTGSGCSTRVEPLETSNGKPED